nr:pitrilysin family protein [Alteromonas sediminis]
MRPYIMASVGMLICTSLVSCQNVSRLSLHDASEPQLQLAHEKYQLDNGLTVILHQDNSDPLVHVDVTYHVGSAREVPGRSGFAHFFEHMMFQGSKHVADEQHFKLITEAGGELNGTTNSDRTNYFQTVPANHLERVLWLESDRMGFLLDAVDQKKFEIQRETVKNERAELIDNQPYGLRDERIAQALYPPEHPYSWPTIGYVEDLNRVDVSDLKQFFLRWYGPNNAVLTIGGDIHIEQTKAIVARYFSDIPAGPQVEKAKPDVVSLQDDRYITLHDQVHLPLLQKTYPTVYARHPDEAPLDVLADILGGGKNALLYKNLVKTGQAVQAVVAHPCRELACEFQIIVLANPEIVPNLALIEKAIKETLDEFEQRGVVADDLNRVKAGIKANAVFELQSVEGKVSLLAANETFYGTPDLLDEDVRRYQSVTKDDVMRVFHQYIKDNASVILSIVPADQDDMAARTSNYRVPDRVIKARASERLTTRKTVSEFDRTTVPEPGPAPVVEVPPFWRSQLANGVDVMGIYYDETPTVTLSIGFEGGVLLEPIEKAGLASLTAMLMNESTQHFGNEEIANELEKLGSQVSVTASGRFIQVEVSALTRHVEKTMALVEEKLLRPAFNADEFERVKAQLLEGKRQQAQDASAMALQARDTLLFGSHNRVSLPDEGTITSIQSMTLADVKSFYKRYLTTHRAHAVIVGNVSERKAKDLLSFLEGLSDQAYDIPQYLDFPEYQEQAIYVIDNPLALQSVVMLVKRDRPFDATGPFFKSQLMNFSLGAAFNSRINLNLREDKSITYGASANFIGGKTLGWYEVRADVQRQSTALAISEILQEIKTFREQGITAEEMRFMRSAYSQFDALNYETPVSKAFFLRKMMGFDLPVDYRRQQLAIINSITEADINTIAQVGLQPDDLQIIVVGDKQQLAAQLNALGLPIKTLELPQ